MSSRHYLRQGPVVGVVLIVLVVLRPLASTLSSQLPRRDTAGLPKRYHFFYHLLQYLEVASGKR